jgi:hypothetical protein
VSAARPTMAPAVKDARPGAETYVVRDDARRLEAGSTSPPAISARTSLSVMRCGSASARSRHGSKRFGRCGGGSLQRGPGVSVHEFGVKLNHIFTIIIRLCYYHNLGRCGLWRERVDCRFGDLRWRFFASARTRPACKSSAETGGLGGAKRFATCAVGAPIRGAGRVENNPASPSRDDGTWLLIRCK